MIHRAVHHGDLQIVVIMSNAGLPEAGDAVMTFRPDVVADPDRCRQAAELPRDASPEELDEAVHRRRDLAVEGFQALTAAASDGDLDPLHRLYDRAVALVRPRVAGWREIWRQNVERQARHTGDISTHSRTATAAT